MAIHQYHRSTWTTEDGLAHNNVLALAQTGDGYLWIGTWEGLLRYDGLRFDLYDRVSTPGLMGNRVAALLVDRDGALWIATDGGVTVYREGGFTGYGAESGLADLRVTALASGPEGKVWAGTLRGLFRFEDGRFTAYGTEQGLPSAYVWALAGDGADLWVATYGGGLSRFDSGSFATVANLSELGITALVPGADGGLWIGSGDSGLSHRDSAGAITRYDSLGGEDIGALLEDRDGSLWVGTRGGLVRLRPGRPAELDGPVAGDILALLEDREGNVWAGSRPEGLTRLSDVAFTTFGPRDGLSGLQTTAVLEDSAGTVWIGTHGDGLNRFAGTEPSVLTTANGLSDDVVLALAEDAEGHLWVGTRGGIDRIEGGTVSSFAQHADVWTLLAASDGSLWVGSFGGAGRYRSGDYEPLLSASEDHRFATVSLLEDRQGAVWIGTIGAGLHRHGADGSLTRLTTAEGLPSDTVFSLYEGEDGVLWIGTRSGLARMDAHGIADLSRVPGLYAGNIYSILEDDGGRLWLSSPRGVVRVARAALERAARTGERVVARLYGMVDGMASSECAGGSLSPAAWKSRDGRLWYPTAKGVAMVDPADLRSNRVAPRVLIERLVVDGLRLPARDRATVRADARRFEFHYAAPSFRSPDRVRFRHRLVGFDEEWVEAGRRRMANYTNLPAGSYRFRVTAANGDGVWAEMPAELGLVIRPRFYMTAWFAALMAVLLAAAVWAVYRQHQRGLEREFSAVLAERTRMAREIHDTLAQGLTGVSIQLEALEETLTSDAEASRQHLDRARGLVRKSLAEAHRSVSNLRPVLLDGGDLAQALARVVDELSAESGARLGFRVVGAARKVPAAVEDNLLRIGQEAVANALRHAGASRVDVELHFDRFEVRLQVSDDGEGFDPRASPAASGHGLVGMRERAEQMEGRFVLRSARGMGTEITVSVPVR